MCSYLSSLPRAETQGTMSFFLSYYVSNLKEIRKEARKTSHCTAESKIKLLKPYNRECAESDSHLFHLLWGE